MRSLAGMALPHRPPASPDDEDRWVPLTFSMINHSNGKFRLLRFGRPLREIISDRVPRCFVGHIDMKFWLDTGIVIQRAQRQAINVRKKVVLAQDRGSAHPAKTSVISRR